MSLKPQAQLTSQTQEIATPTAACCAQQQLFRRPMAPGCGSKPARRLVRVHSSIQEEVLLPLGLDFLTFLAATVIVIPVFKSVKASPVLGFLFSGLVLGQLG